MLGGLSLSESPAEVLCLVNYTHNTLFPCGFPILPSSIAVTAPRIKKKKRITTRSALSDGGGMVVDKEFEFKPTFDEYLKAMESVKIDRGNNSNNDSSSTPHTSKIQRKKKSIKKIEDSDDEMTAVQENSRKGNMYRRGEPSRGDSRKGDSRKEFDSEKVYKKQHKDVKILDGKKSYSSESKLLDMERAAFKSLECEDDVIGKPRITRADMEERIQKLAKW